MRSVIKQSQDIWIAQTHALYEGEKIHLRWDNMCWPAGATKHQISYLLDAMRGFFEARVDLSELSRSTLSPLTLKGWNQQLRRFGEWMAAQDIWRFSQLTEEDLLEHVKSRMKETSDGKFTQHTISQYFSFFEDLYTLRAKYTSGITLSHSEIMNLQSEFKDFKPQVKWKALEKEHAESIFLDAMDWIKNEAPLVIKIVRDLYEASRQCVGKTYSQRKQWFRKIYREIEQSTEYQHLKSKMMDESKIPATVILNAQTNTWGAAAAIVLLLVGLRVKELLSLKHDCVTEKVHSDGFVYQYINGIQGKKNGRRKSWIAPAPVIEALKVLEQLYVWPINPDKKPFIFYSYGSTGAPQYIRSAPRKLMPGNLNNRFKRFVKGKSRTYPFPSSKRLHSHQGRKTFAHFCATKDKRALGALAPHFGHVHSGITDDSYVGTDFELLEMISEEHVQEIESGLMDLLTSKNVGGGASVHIEQFRDEVRVGDRFRGKRVIKAVIDRLIQNGVQLAPCDWGYCLYAQVTAACKGDQKGPNEILRHADVCSGCENFSVSEKYRSFWEDRHRADSEYLKSTVKDEQTIHFVGRRIARTEEVLRGLNLKVRNEGL